MVVPMMQQLARHPCPCPWLPHLSRPKPPTGIHPRAISKTARHVFQTCQQLSPVHVHARVVQARSSLTSTLNDEQQHAVQCSDLAVRVKAGPGSGKTRVVTTRVAHLLQQGVDPSSILVITFTNKAAQELKERLTKVLGQQQVRALAAGTFHGICARILRSYVEQLPNAGLSADFTILDTDDSARAMRKVVDAYLERTRSESVGAKEANKMADQLYNAFSRLKNKHPTLHGVRLDKMEVDWGAFDILLMEPDHVPKAFEAYTRVCRENNGVDFDDLLGLTVALMQQNPGVRHLLSNRWQHVLVDEFQDTNAAQYELVRLLQRPGPHSSRSTASTTFVVGDPDQAIYGWRGANPDNMDLAFEKHFPGCATVFLSRNYRSGTNILDAAEAVLSHAGMPRLHQKLIPMTGITGHVQYVIARDERREASYVANAIQSHRNKGMGYEEIAILYRTNSQSRKFEEALSTARIPFRVLGEKAFWSRSEIKVMIAYLRLIANPAIDNLALEAIINVPARGMGDKTLLKLSEVGKSQGKNLAGLLMGDLRTAPLLTPAQLDPLVLEVQQKETLPERAMDIVPDLGSQLSKQHGLKIPKQGLQGLQQLRALVLMARSMVMHRSVGAAVTFLLLASGYQEHVANEAGTNTEKRLGNLQVFNNIAHDPDSWTSQEEDLRLEQAGASSSSSQVEVLQGDGRLLGMQAGGAEAQLGRGLEQLQLFLQHIALMTSMDDKNKDEAAQRVTLMTLHTAKGLEYETIFFVGFEDGLVPFIRGTGTDTDFAEEKRLAYVGVTRAKKHLHLVRAQTRTSRGSWNGNTKASRYMTLLAGCQMQRTVLEGVEEESGHTAYDSSSSSRDAGTGARQQRSSSSSSQSGRSRGEASSRHYGSSSGGASGRRSGGNGSSSGSSGKPNVKPSNGW